MEYHLQEWVTGDRDFVLFLVSDCLCLSVFPSGLLSLADSTCWSEWLNRELTCWEAHKTGNWVLWTGWVSSEAYSSLALH